MNEDYRFEAVKEKVAMLMEGGDLSFILGKVKERVALQIISTNPEEGSKREDLYQLIRGIQELERELQSYVNDIERLKESN